METKIEMTAEQALANYLECDIEDAESQIESGGYLVLNDKEADEAAREHIKDSVWAFRASFILSECDLDFSGEASLESIQGNSCESANDFILSLVEKTCGLDEFVKSAISADGRGHFLSGYDGCEIEQDAYFIYRLN